MAKIRKLLSFTPAKNVQHSLIEPIGCFCSEYLSKQISSNVYDHFVDGKLREE